MTKVEAIKYAENKAAKIKLRFDAPESLYGYYAIYSTELEFLHEALQALRTQQEPTQNAPLTLDELREMDGEPVYTVALDYGRNRWSFVSADCELVRFYTTRRGVACDVIGRYFKTYGKTWLAYRRKPEEVTA